MDGFMSSLQRNYPTRSNPPKKQFGGLFESTSRLDVGRDMNRAIN
jgi:hypothetical protein